MQIITNKLPQGLKVHNYSVHLYKKCTLKYFQIWSHDKYQEQSSTFTPQRPLFLIFFNTILIDFNLNIILALNINLNIIIFIV